MRMRRSYSELVKLKTFRERFEYLKLDGKVCDPTFGGARWVNQLFYNKISEWKEARRRVIVRDLGNDLGCEGWPIMGRIYVHHMNPITREDILKRSPDLLDPENLICCSFDVHQAITFGSEDLLPQEFTERTQGDTCPWKRLI